MICRKFTRFFSLVRSSIFQAFAILLLYTQATGLAQAQRPRVLPPPSSKPVTPGVKLPQSAKQTIVVSPQPVASTTDGLALISIFKAQNDAIRSRLSNRIVNGKLKKATIPTGAAGMDLFTTADHEKKKYVRNPNLWAQDLMGKLSGISIYNSFTQESYGGILITPRHLLFCAHAHPYAAQTWGPNLERPGAVHRFLTSSGKLVESLQLHQADRIDAALFPGLGSVDLCVALLDRNMEAEGLKVIPIFPPVSEPDVFATMKWAQKEDQPFAFIGISQGTSRPTAAEPPEPITNYPRKHQRMCYLKDLRDPVKSSSKLGPFAPWNYTIWDGDSGSPTFLLLKGEPQLWMILTAAPGNGPRVGSYIDHVNALISTADENAISLKRLDKPTCLKVRVGKL